jgi:hypothetical protein
VHAAGGQQADGDGDQQVGNDEGDQHVKLRGKRV